MRSQLVRLPRSRLLRRRTSTQAPCSFSPASVNLSSPLRRGLCRVAISGPKAEVPEHDGAAAILALRDGALEVPVIERVILGLDGKALVAGVKRRALGQGPGFKDAIDLKTQVIVKPCRGVLLDDK